MIWIKENTLPEVAAQRSLSKPPGQAAVFLWDTARDLLRHPGDRCRTEDGKPTKYASPWPKHGADRVKHRVEWFFTRYKAAGGRVDQLVLDFEQGFTIWARKPEHLRAIRNDPRFVGLKDRSKFSDIDKVIRRHRSGEYLAWNATMRQLVCQALNAAVFDPVLKLYPDMKSSDYNAYILKKTEVVPGFNGHRQFGLAHCGTHGSRSFYGNFGLLARERLDGKNRYGRSPFAVLRWSINTVRAIKRSSNVPFMPWVSHKRFKESVFRDNLYYEELIYHLALSGIDGFLYWNPRVWKTGQNPDHFTNDDQDRLLDHCLQTVNEQIGDETRQSVTTDPIRWDSGLLATGLRIGQNKVLWRITVPQEVKQVRVMPSGRVLDLLQQVGVWHTAAPGAVTGFERVDRP